MSTDAAAGQPEEFDCIVIGGGQGGSLAAQLAHGGQKTALIEKSEFGGTCVNRGCTPTKTLVASARVAHFARNAARWGVRASDVGVDMEAIVARKDAIVREFREYVEASLDIPNLSLVRGAASFCGPRQVQVLAGGKARVLTADTVVIATGGEHAVPPIEGLDSVPWLDADKLMALREVPTHLLILGGGYIACEFAQAFQRFGARVTIVEQKSMLLDREDPEVSQAVREILEGEGVQVLVGAQVQCVAQKDDEIALQVLVGEAEEPREMRGSHLLVATGRRPATKVLNLQVAGVACDDKGFVAVDEYLAASAPGVFALGDVAGSAPFTHIAFDDGRILAGRILRGEKRSVQSRIPTWTVFLDPQLGRAGLSESEARAQGLDFEVARIEMKDVARPVEVGEPHGFWKVLVEKDSGKILGGAFLSLEGGEMAGLCLVAMTGGMTYQTLRDLPIAHPTLAESWNNLFLKMDRERA
jgi:pyruvate/2-oxoglutarate dehydrogenase complex dihydrolipoamide dehydrogenase (E3) component